MSDHKSTKSIVVNGKEAKAFAKIAESNGELDEVDFGSIVPNRKAFKRFIEEAKLLEDRNALALLDRARVALPGSQRQPLKGASIERPVNNDQVINVTVVLRRKEKLSSPESFAFSNPKTVRYRSREEFSSIHGAAAADIAFVEAIASEYGLSLTGSSQARRTVVLSGTAENVQRCFGVSLHHYNSPTGAYRGRTGPVMIPGRLESIVTAVLGLDTTPIAKPHVRIKGTRSSASLTPLEVARAYNFPTQVNGAGQTIGIIELGGGYRTADLKAYFKGLGLNPPVIKSVSVSGAVNRPGIDHNSDGEVMLDIAVAGAIAPGANLVVYFAPNSEQGFVDAIATAVQDPVNRPSVITISWGSAEDNWTHQALSAMLQAVEDAAAVGVTVIAAAGEGHDDGEADGDLHVDMPAVLPTVLACGGTRIDVNGVIKSEVVWNDRERGKGATGGGVSKIFPIPSYQASAGVPRKPGLNFPGRGVPDVAGNAAPCYRMRVNGKGAILGGTGAVAPLWAGLIALINQSLGCAVGFANPALYQIGASTFRDIISGNNGYYSAGAGWDACTGLGSPNGTALMNALRREATSIRS
jgi:kumamolisin